MLKAALAREAGMSGWRDTEGRTASDRRKPARETAHAEFADTARHRPLTLLKGLAGFAFMLVLAFALVMALR
jgi:hypothetical protein